MDNIPYVIIFLYSLAGQLIKNPRAAALMIFIADNRAENAFPLHIPRSRWCIYSLFSRLCDCCLVRQREREHLYASKQLVLAYLLSLIERRPDSRLHSYDQRRSERERDPEGGCSVVYVYTTLHGCAGSASRAAASERGREWVRTTPSHGLSSLGAVVVLYSCMHLWAICASEQLTPAPGLRLPVPYNYYLWFYHCISFGKRTVLHVTRTHCHCELSFVSCPAVQFPRRSFSRLVGRLFWKGLWL